MSNTYIHPTANISPNVKIGEGTKIWINSQIREKSEIGSNCIISKDTYIDVGVKIGNNCKIQNSVSVYQGVIIEDGPNACFTNDKVPRAFDPEWKVIPTLVKKGASIGANATIVCGITIGEYAMVAAGSVVTKDVLPYSLVMGNPARHYSYVDMMGNKIKESLNE